MGYPPQGTARGITRLSELEIDADKNWLDREITEIGALAQAMAKGDLPVRNDFRIILIKPGPPGYVLTSAGPLNIPSWQPTGSETRLYLPCPIISYEAAAVVPVDHSQDLTALIATAHEEPGPTMQPSISATPTATGLAAPDQTADRTASPASHYGLEDAVGGAVADDGGVQTNETAAANNDTANDMTLLPAVPAVNDAYYLGHANTFGAAWLKQSTKGAGVWTITWEYWNGAWVPLAGVTDETNGFRPPTNDGVYRISFTIPGDWAQTIVQGMNLYWIRGRVSVYTSVTIQPKGRRAWIERVYV